MANIKLVEPPTPRKTLTQYRNENEALTLQLERIKEGAYCYMCGEFKSKDKFYKSTNPDVKSGVCPICRNCALDIAERKDKNGESHEPTRESLISALRYLDKPFIDSLYSSSMNEVTSLKNEGSVSNVAKIYFRNMQTPHYSGMTFMDSTFFKKNISYKENPLDKKNKDFNMDEESDEYIQFIKDKEDTIRLIGYDCFKSEPLEDQPFLYSQFLGMLDGNNGNSDETEDIIKINSIITIARSFMQIKKIEDAISGLMVDVYNISENMAEINNLTTTKQKIGSYITNLASESCISLKNNRNAKKGDNTWTGKLNKLKDIDLRESGINGFNIGTCKGMQQVADISAEAIFKALKLDESDYTQMISEQRQKLTQANQKADAYREAARIILKENLNLRKFLADSKVGYNEYLIDIDDVVNTYLEGTN